jgi:putative tryptophan/tyrosine transport system substrate-binding protein
MRFVARFSIEATEAPVHDVAEVEREISLLAREPSGGLVVLPDPFIISHR